MPNFSHLKVYVLHKISKKNVCNISLHTVGHFTQMTKSQGAFLALILAIGPSALLISTIIAFSYLNFNFDSIFRSFMMLLMLKLVPQNSWWCWYTLIWWGNNCTTMSKSILAWGPPNFGNAQKKGFFSVMSSPRWRRDSHFNNLDSPILLQIQLQSLDC